jgi:hypothetical protein
MGAWSCPPSPGVQESFGCWKLRKWMNMDEEIAQIVPDRPKKLRLYMEVSQHGGPQNHPTFKGGTISGFAVQKNLEKHPTFSCTDADL